MLFNKFREHCVCLGVTLGQWLATLVRIQQRVEGAATLASNLTKRLSRTQPPPQNKTRCHGPSVGNKSPLSRAITDCKQAVTAGHTKQGTDMNNFSISQHGGSDVNGGVNLCARDTETRNARLSVSVTWAPIHTNGSRGAHRLQDGKRNGARRSRPFGKKEFAISPPFSLRNPPKMGIRRLLQEAGSLI